MVTLELIESFDGLAKFLPQWSHFLTVIRPPTPFQTLQWLLPWGSHFASRRLYVMVFRVNDSVVGILPCFLHDWNGRRQLTIMGTGLSDYLDPVFDPRYSECNASVLAAHLERAPEWEVCDWQDLSAGTPLAILGPTCTDVPCTAVRLSASFDQFISGRPHGLRRNLRRYRDKLESLGRLQFVASETADACLLDALVQLHRARWQRSSEPGIIDQNRAEAFIREAARSLAGCGMLRLFALYLDARIIAVILALRHSTTIFSYLSAFDPEYERFGCGRDLLGRAFEYAHTNAYRYWNFLRGEENYKITWGAEIIQKCRLTLSRA